MKYELISHQRGKKMKVIAFDFQGTLADHSNPPQLFSGVKQVLDILKDKCILIVISEGRDIDNLDKLLMNLKIKQYFKHIIHLKGTSLRKADGSAFLDLIRKLDIQPLDLIVVGDVPASDIRGAKLIGAMGIRIRSGKYTSLEALTDIEKADYEIYNMMDLLKILSLN